jgi:outer membrane protein OmpA-like peptidoglycan-associated protein
MTAGRAATIARWMQKQGVDPTQVHSYGLAQHSSRTDNSTMRKREQNRRVSLYLVPNKHLLKLAKKGKVQ